MMTKDELGVALSTLIRENWQGEEPITVAMVACVQHENHLENMVMGNGSESSHEHLLRAAKAVIKGEINAEQ